MNHIHMGNISTQQYLAIGCKMGQKVYQQLREIDGIYYVYVYDGKTEKLIGRIKVGRT